MKNSFYIKKNCPAEEIRQKASLVRPTERQIRWNKRKFKIFIHFGMNTAQNREWGTGQESLADFDITSVDCRQWVRCVKNAGADGIILCCKHHDGFCMWDTSTTAHKITNTKFQGKDPVSEVASLCREYDLKFGIYLSPWDRNHPTYGTETYNDVYIRQLEELLTGYGDVDEVWLDGACGEGKNGKKQRYDWARIFNTVRKLMPNAVISISATDIRWCGNEEGLSRESEWSVQFQEFPCGYDFENFVSEGLQLTDGEYLAQDNLGDLGQIREINQTKGGMLTWFPCQIDVSIRPGWFYHSDEDGMVRSLKNLKDLYFASVGNNSQFLLNIPPDRNGKFCSIDEQRMYQLGAYLRAMYAVNFLEDADIIYDSGSVIRFCLGKHIKFNTLCFEEDIVYGQQIEEFQVFTKEQNGEKLIYRGTTIGGRRLAEVGEQYTDEIVVKILNTRGGEFHLQAYAYDAPLLPKNICIDRMENGQIRICGDEDLFYTVNNGIELKYTKPFDLKYGGTVTAYYKNTEEYFPLCGDQKITKKIFAEDGLYKVYPFVEKKKPIVLHGFPCEIIMEMQEELIVQGISLLSKRLGHSSAIQNCMPTKCDVYVSGNNISYKKIISGYVFENIVNNPIEQYIPCKTASKFIKICFLEGAAEEICIIHDIRPEVQKIEK